MECLKACSFVSDGLSMEQLAKPAAKPKLEPVLIQREKLHYSWMCQPAACMHGPRPFAENIQTRSHSPRHSRKAVKDVCQVCSRLQLSLRYSDRSFAMQGSHVKT